MTRIRRLMRFSKQLGKYHEDGTLRYETLTIELYAVTLRLEKNPEGKQNSCGMFEIPDKPLKKLKRILRANYYFIRLTSECACIIRFIF